MSQVKRVWPAPGERGGIIGGLVVTFFVICGIAAVTCFYIATRIRVHESRNDVQVETPFGSVHVRHNGSGQPNTGGLPVYPGATLVRNRESATVDISSPAANDELHIVAGHWRTGDNVDKVRQFYENKFPEMSVIRNHGQVEMHTIDGRSKRVIVLKEHHGWTEISLASVGEPGAN